MNKPLKFLIAAISASTIASCGGGGGDSAFPDDPVFNQTNLTQPSSVYPGTSSPADFELASVYQGGNYIVGSKNVFYSAGPNDRNFTISMTFDESDLSSGTFTGSGTSKPVNSDIQITSLNFDQSTRNFCVNIRGTAVSQPKAFAVFGTQSINLATLGASEHFCTDIGVDQSGNRFIATKPVTSSLAASPGQIGSPAIYRAPVNSSTFVLFWSGEDKYVAEIDDLNNPGQTINEIRDLMVSGLSISGDIINWTGTFRADPNTDVSIGVQDATFLHEDSASTIVLPIEGTRLNVSNLGEGTLFFAEEIVSVSNGSEIYMLPDEQEGAQAFSGLSVFVRGNQVSPVNTGSDCSSSFAIRDLQNRQYACFKKTGGFFTKLLLN